MCDSKRAHSSCSGPEGSSLTRLASFCDGVLDSLQTVINRVQFHGINLRLGANCAPVVEALLESLLLRPSLSVRSLFLLFLLPSALPPKEMLSLLVCWVVGPA